MNAIKNARKRIGITQKALALKLNVTQGAIALWETSKVNPRTDKLIEMAKILDCSVDELLKEG